MLVTKSADSNLYNNSSEDFVPIACHYNENTLLTKNGQLLQTIQIDGINSDKISKDLFNLRAVVRKAIGESVDGHKYAFWIHTIRRKADLDDNAEYYGFLSANIHDIWCRKNYWHDKFVNMLYITIVHDATRLKLKNFNSLVNSLSPKIITNFEEKFFAKASEELTITVDKILQGLSEYGAHRLGIRVEEDECYSDPMFLFRRIMQLNENNCPVPIADISSVLASHQYAVGNDKIEVTGEEGKKFAALMSIKEYQEVSSEALDRFLQIPVEMVATEVFYFVDKKEVIKQYKHQNYILGVSRDEELKHLKGLDKIFAKEESGVRFCHQQISFMVIGEDLKALDSQVKKASEALAKIGIIHVREDINLEKTFWAQLPANFSFLARMKPTVIENTAALASLHNFPTGNQYNPWGRAVTLLRTERGTPYFMNFHDKTGRGTTCIFGNKRSGRTTLLNFLLSEADKYFPTVLYFTDNMDSGLYIKARNGSWFQREKNIINPLLCEDTPENREYMFEFFKIIARHYFDPLQETELNLLKSISDKVFNIPIEQRKLSSILASSITEADKNSESLNRRIKDYLEGGIYYGVFETEEPLSIAEGELVAINLQAFDDEQYIKNNYPKEKKLIEQFEYDLNSMRAVKAGIVFATQKILLAAGVGPKIFVVDNFAELVNLEQYHSLITYFSNKMHEANGVAFLTINTDEVIKQKVPKTISQNWLAHVNTSFILPSESTVVGFGEVFDLSPAELKKLSSMTVSSRMFLVKQDNITIAAELSIGGLPGLTRLLCSGEAERNIYKEVIKDTGNASPEDWVEAVYSELENIT
ncbi:MAG: VirB4 family type IV secretion/conjugal transfer ATPase [Rickettsiaceae bacterium]